MTVLTSLPSIWSSELLKRIAAEKARLVKAGEIRNGKGEYPDLTEPPFELPNNWTWAAFDPACGTGGFLTCAINHMRKQYVKRPEDEARMQTSLRAVEKKQLPHMLCVE